MMKSSTDPFEDEIARAARTSPQHSSGPSGCISAEQLADFYSGRLGEAGADRVRAHLADCASCLEAAGDARHFTDAMRGLEAAASVDTAAHGGHRRRWWLAAAAVAGLAAGLFAYRAAGRGPQVAVQRWDDLVIAKAPYVPGDRGEDLLWRGGAGTFDSGMEAYASGDLESAALLLRQRLLEAPDHAEAGFYLGVALILLDRPEEALAPLERVQGAAGGTLRQEARWYLALARLKTGQRSSALRLLEAVTADPSDPRHQDAMELLRRMRDGPRDP